MSAKFVDRIWIGFIAAITLFALLGAYTPMRLLCVCVFGIVLYAKHWNLVPAALLLLLFYWNATGALLIPAGLPVVYFLIPAGLTFLLLLPFSKAREHLPWPRNGELDTITVLLMVATSMVAAAALLAWSSWTENLGAGAGMAKELEGIPRWFLFLVGVPAFALLNAFAEEIFYRGFMQGSLEKRFPGKDELILGLQASAFAAAHYAAGFPNGKMGYIMTFIYALMLGYLKMRSKGLLAPFLTHVVADLVIGYTLVLLAG